MTKARDLAQAPNQSFSFKNRIINGDMRIDQRNAGASVTVNGDIYTLDRWKVFQSAAGRFSVQQNAGSVTPPAGFTNYLGVTSIAATTPTSGQYFLVDQWIEGFNVADLGWGGSNAQPITLSFWVRSSVTGTHTGAIGNAVYTRSYAFTYTVSSANTWEYKTVTIPGDTTGSWFTNNGTGIALRFAMSIGSGRSTATPNVWNAFGTDGASAGVNVLASSGNTWYITGVQLERGSTATSWDARPYGTELALCRRYYTRYGQNANGAAGDAGAFNLAQWSGNSAYAAHWFQVSMRAAPSFSYSSNSDFTLLSNGATRTPSGMVQQGASIDRCEIRVDVTSALTGGNSSWLRISTSSGFLAWEAEL